MDRTSRIQKQNRNDHRTFSDATDGIDEYLTPKLLNKIMKRRR